MKTEKQTFSKYGLSFQENLLKILVLEKQFCDQMMEVLDYSYFETEQFRTFWKILSKYKNEYKTHPTISTLETIVNTKANIENISVSTQIKAFLSELSRVEEIRDSEFIKQKSIEFCKKQKIKEAMLDSIKDLENDDFDSAHSKIDESFKLGLDNDVGHDFMDDIDYRYSPTARIAIPYPWDCMNSITKGGIGQSEVHVVLAGTGVGKSITLVNFAANAAKLGYNIVYYTFENPDFDIGQRMDAYLTRIPMEKLHNHKDQIKEVSKTVKGKLIIKSYPMHTHTIRTVENHLNRLRAKGIKIDAVVIDYAELMLPSDGGTGLDGEVKVMYDTVSFAQRMNIPVMTAAQGNRDAIDEDVVTMKHVQGAYKKYGPIHFVLTLSQAGNAFSAKNRIGKSDLTFPFTKNGDIMTIDIRTGYSEGFSDIKKEIDPKEELQRFIEKQKRGNKKNDY
jgi:replicative DNA helicase